MYRMRPAEFEYHRPTSLDEAISLLGEIEDSRALAGGHSLLPMMKLRLATPAALVDIGRIEGLDGISGNGDLTIGALATHAAVAGSQVAIGIAPVIPETAGHIGDRQVRSCGTIGGSVAHADPGADYPTVLKALGATITVTGKGGEREIPADDFFRGIFETALEPGELVTSVTIPATASETGAAYLKHAHPASRYAVAGVAAVVSVEDGSCTSARVTVGGVTSPPAHATAAAESLVGGAGTEDAISAAAAKVPESLPDATSDAYASGEYRTHLAKVLAKRALTKAFERAG
jgi:aerobic carbon-monoxide dehydrogenase medium subunit